MTRELSGKRVAILAADGVERAELEQPRDELTDHGARTDLLSLEPGDIEARRDDQQPAGGFTVDALVEDAAVRDYDLLLLPGGTSSPDTLGANPSVRQFVASFVGSGKPVVAICRGPQLLADAGVLAGRTVTGHPSVQPELGRAGARVRDDGVVVDGNLITGRSPDDLTKVVAAILHALR